MIEFNIQLRHYLSYLCGLTIRIDYIRIPSKLEAICNRLFQVAKICMWHMILQLASYTVRHCSYAWIVS